MTEKLHHWHSVSSSKYIGSWDLPSDGTDIVLTIDHVNFDETVTSTRGKSKKHVVYWKEPDWKPMVLNVTNAGRIRKVSGQDYMEDWGGTQVQLYVEHGVKSADGPCDAVRVRPHKPRIPCADCGRPLEPAMGKDVAWLSEYTGKKYGRILCAACAQKAAEEKNETEQQQLLQS